MGDENDTQWSDKILDDRYQHQNFLVKVWRCRYYLLVPWSVFMMWWSSRKNPHTQPFPRWSLAIGLAQTCMRYWYTWNEIKLKNLGKD